MNNEKQAEWIGEFKDNYLSLALRIMSPLCRDAGEIQKKLLYEENEENRRELICRWFETVEEGLQRIEKIIKEALSLSRDVKIFDADCKMN